MKMSPTTPRASRAAASSSQLQRARADRRRQVFLPWLLLAGWTAGAAAAVAAAPAAAPAAPASPPGVPAAAAAESPGGHWEGTIDVPGSPLPVLVDLVDPRRPGGAWTGSIDIPSQRAKKLPLEAVTVAGNQVHFALRGVPGAPAFDGALAGGAIQGAFTQGGASFPFHLSREALPPPRRPQEPKPPFPYFQREVAYDNGAIHLAGTLTLPHGPAPFPAVLLITGSGAQNRDEEILGHKPFLVIADRLTRAGIAVLRVDDRGIGGSTGDNDSSTEDDFITDVLAGVRFLRSQPEIAADRIGLLGHSEGGTIAPLAANRSRDVAFLVLLAGTGVPGDDILMSQTEWLLRAAGTADEVLQKRLAVERRILDLVRTEKSAAVLRDLLRPLLRESLDQASPEERAALGGQPGAFVERTLDTISSPWFRSFVSYDPRPALRRVRVPVLALNGDKDTQVPAAENLRAIESALHEAGDKDVTVRLLPGLNHLFQHAATGSPADYASIEETLSPEVLDIVTHWILDRFSARRAAAAAH